MKTEWLIQTNLIQEHLVDRIQAAVELSGAEYTGFSIIPFSAGLDLPADKAGSVMVPYGSTTLIKNFLASSLDKRGLFFEPAQFRTSLWCAKLPFRMLNGDSEKMLMSEAVELPHKSYFIKPDNDLKDFTGGEMTPPEMAKVHSALIANGVGDIEVVVSAPKNTGWEYRLFMFRDQVITSSSYKLRSRILTDKRVPAEVHDFATETAKIWRPDEFYVMDIVDTEHGFKVVEFNCINASGFYSCEVEKVVQKITEYVKSL